MSEHHEHFFPLLIILFAAVVIISVFLVFKPTTTGNIVAQGGQISQMNLETHLQTQLWLGVYGLILTNQTEEVFFSSGGGQILQANLTHTQNYTNNTVIVATTQNITSWTAISPANYSQINSFLGVTSLHSQSADNTFTGRYNFTINNIVYEVYSATVNSVSGTYVTGAIMINETVAFITTPFSGFGFDNTSVDYQLLLSVPFSGSVNYTFYVFEQNELPSSGSTFLDCSMPTNLTTILSDDNVSSLVTWDSIPGATGYEVSYIDSPIPGYFNFSNATNISVGTALYYNDTTPSSARYYKLRVLGSSACLSNETAGYITTALTPDYNLVTFPFLSSNNSIPEVLRSIDGSYSEVLEFNNTDKTYKFYLIVGTSVFSNFDTITPFAGYWIRVTNNATLRMTGTVQETLNETLTPDYNLVGFPVIANTNENRSVPYVLDAIDGNYSEVLVLNNTNKIYDFYLVVGTSVFKNFDDIYAGRGYWIRVGTNATLNYTNS